MKQSQHHAKVPEIEQRIREKTNLWQRFYFRIPSTAVHPVVFVVNPVAGLVVARGHDAEGSAAVLIVIDVGDVLVLRVEGDTARADGLVATCIDPTAVAEGDTTSAEGVGPVHRQWDVCELKPNGCAIREVPYTMSIMRVSLVLKSNSAALSLTPKDQHLCLKFSYHVC